MADAAGITDVAVDASDIYWMNGTTGMVLRCATGQVGATRMPLDAKFVHWMTGSAVLKVAK